MNASRTGQAPPLGDGTLPSEANPPAPYLPSRDAPSRGLADWQRLDLWLWCARFRRGRADCAALIASGAVRLNRQPTDKAHAKLRVGDVLTLALGTGPGGAVRVVRVRALAARRGPAEAARRLYEEIGEG